MGKCCRAEYICGLTEFIEDVVGGGGGGGTPGAPVNSVQYNSAGAFAGDSAFTYSGTALALTGTGSALTLNRSASALTTSLPALSITQTWNAVGTTFTGAVINVTDTASAVGSKLFDAQLGGVSRLNVNKSGLTAINGPAIAGNGEILTLTNSLGTASLRVGTGNQFIIGGDIAAVGNASLISASAHLKFGTGSDAGILYTAAGALKVTDGSSGLGTITASGASITPAWSGTGTATTPLLVNVTADPGPSNAASKLIDTQVLGSSRFWVTSDGRVNASDRFVATFFTTGPSAFSGFYARTNTSPAIGLGTADDVILTRTDADRLALRRSTNAQRFEVYRTYTDASTYERGVMGWYDSASDNGTAGTTFRIGTEKGSVGGTAQAVSIVTGGVERINVTTGGNVFIGSNKTLSFGGGEHFDPLIYSGTGELYLRSSVIQLQGRSGANGGHLNFKGHASIVSASGAILGITNGSTGPGKLAIDNVQGANLERLKVEWDTNVARIGTEKAGSGTSRDLAFITDNTIRMVIYGNGGINTGGNTVTAYKLQQTSSRLEIQAPETISTAGTTGNAGSICYDSDYIYVAVGANTWKRVAIATW